MYNSLHIEDFIKKNHEHYPVNKRQIRQTLNNLQYFYCIYLTYKVVIPREKVAMTLYRIDLFFLCLIMSIYAKKKN